MMTFDLIVEGDRTAQVLHFPDPTRAVPPALELVRLEWHDDAPPDVVVLERGVVVLVKVGRYAAPGNRYCYRVASAAQLVNGRLHAAQRVFVRPGGIA